MRQLRICLVGGGDLPATLRQNGYDFSTAATFQQAVEQARHGDSICVLSDSYPVPTLAADDSTLKKAAAKQLRLYLEYPSFVEGVSLGDILTTKYERMICCSDFFGEGLLQNSIMMLNGCYYRPAVSNKPLLCLAKAAGYDKLAFSLPEEHAPLLFFHPQYTNVLIATSSLSRFITARYAPYAAIRGLWEGLLQWACKEEVNIEWIPTVTTAYKKEQSLPDDAETAAIQHGIDWMSGSMVYGFDETVAIFEGYSSPIDHMGRQLVRNCTRADCNGEASMAFALDYALRGAPDSRRLAEKITDFLFSDAIYHGEASSELWGLLNWFSSNTDNPVFYGDDNARALLGALTVRGCLGSSQWDEQIFRAIFANLRTAAKTGFRYGSLNKKDLTQSGKTWRDYHNEEFTEYAPHYQAYLWAVYLWAYRLCGEEELLEKAKTAIGMCMEQYPDGWRWTNSLTAEMSRMLLPLAFLVQVEDTPTHRAWLELICRDVLKQLQPCGAFRDLMGNLKNGCYPPPQSNESYGTSEASLIQQNGDPATDLLYAANWAFIGLHEAAIALSSKELKEAEDQMADFFCRIQTRSTLHPNLSGCWMRSFDYEKWEYWGSSADAGWGAWSVESGWTNAWILATFELRQENASLMNISFAPQVGSLARRIYHEMLE